MPVAFGAQELRGPASHASYKSFPLRPEVLMEKLGDGGPLQKLHGPIPFARHGGVWMGRMRLKA